MKTILDPLTTPEEKLSNFQRDLRRILRIPKQKLDESLASDKIANQGKPKRGPKPRQASASDLASDSGS
jgi:hypothetical protein